MKKSIDKIEIIGIPSGEIIIIDKVRINDLRSDNLIKYELIMLDKIRGIGYWLFNDTDRDEILQWIAIQSYE